MPTILVTGGAGYIGSHVCKALAKAGHLPVAFDHLKHGHARAVRWGPLVQGDLNQKDDLDRAFRTYRPDGVIHLASLINLRESFENPHLYYLNNVVGTLSLLKAMVDHEVTGLVFSSSAAVYASWPNKESLPFRETHPLGSASPYGTTKIMCEQLIADFCAAYGLKAICLRYFNAAGADPDGEIGEAHSPETHVIPRLLFTAQGKQPHFTLYHSHHPTKDKTAIRDYIHVSDLATGHLLALQHLPQIKGMEPFNLGTGEGCSVLELIQKAEQVTGRSIQVRREESPSVETPLLVADVTKAKKVLGFQPQFSDLETILTTAWQWHNTPVLV